MQSDHIAMTNCTIRDETRGRARFFSRADPPRSNLKAPMRCVSMCLKEHQQNELMRATARRRSLVFCKQYDCGICPAWTRAAGYKGWESHLDRAVLTADDLVRCKEAVSWAVEISNIESHGPSFDSQSFPCASHYANQSPR